jgi:ubiquinone/menaquinone biosynthesis C-methylase UbiE
MDREAIRTHWENWASSYGAGLRATTKTWTAKALELDALSRRFRNLLRDIPAANILEAGCGNGVNCVHLAKIFGQAHFDGVDFVDEMIAGASANARSGNVADRARFFVGDALKLSAIDALRDAYDVVFTDRCLINLNTIELQKDGISALARKLRPGGHLVMIENSKTSNDEQNRCREMLGLPPRTPAEFNLFFDEQKIRNHIEAIGLDLVDVEDFSSLHDLALYVLAPAINNGKLDYEHPLVHAATKLSLETSGRATSAFGSFGQNRMFICQRRA